MQRFDTFTLAPEAQPVGSLPPPEWKQGKGRETFEKLWPNSALTSFVKVSSCILPQEHVCQYVSTGWPMGPFRPDIMMHEDS